MITVNDGNSGNTVSGSTLASTNAITVHAGTGKDVLTGGAGNDVFYAGGDTTMTGGAGTNQFVFTAPRRRSNTIADFAASSTNELVFSNSGFSLGLTGGTTTPQALSASQAATLFTANSTGAFANTSQRLAYDTTNGELFSSTGGSGGTSHLVATLTGEPAINTATSCSSSAEAHGCPAQIWPHVWRVRPNIQPLESRHGRTCSGHPRTRISAKKAWITGTSPAMTTKSGGLEAVVQRLRSTGQPWLSRNLRAGLRQGFIADRVLGL